MLQSLFRMSLAMYTLYLYNNHVGKFSFILLVMLAMIFSSLHIADAVLSVVPDKGTKSFYLRVSAFFFFGF